MQALTPRGPSGVQSPPSQPDATSQSARQRHPSTSSALTQIAPNAQSSTPSAAHTAPSATAPAAMQENPPEPLGRQRGVSTGQKGPTGPFEQVESTVSSLPSPDPVASAPRTKPPSTSRSANPLSLQDSRRTQARLADAERKALLHRSAKHARRTV